MIDIIVCVYSDGLRPNYDGKVEMTWRSEDDGLEGGDKRQEALSRVSDASLGRSLHYGISFAPLARVAM
jgi:hypothetical protein